MLRTMKIFCLVVAMAAASEAGQSIEDLVTHESKESRRTASQAAHGTYSNSEYKTKYRVTKRVFNYVLGRIRDLLFSPSGRIPAHMQLAIFLRHCGHGLAVRDLMVDYGLSQRQCVHILRKVSMALISLKRVRWPSLDEQRKRAREFQAYQPLFDGAIGAVDGTHVKVNENQDTKQYFVNRKGWPSVSIMAVCGMTLRFTHLTFGASGRVHDARVFNMSDLPDILNNPLITLPYYYILGDGAYGNRTMVMAPSVTTSTLGENR